MKRGDFWVSSFLLGVVLFNWPFLTIFEGSTAGGLFLLWGAIIVLAALAGVVGKRDRER